MMLKRYYVVALLLVTILPIACVRGIWLQTETVTVTVTTTVTASSTSIEPTRAYVIVGAPVKPSPGPAATAPADWADGTAAAIMMGMVTSAIFSFDTNSSLVDPVSGAPEGGGDIIIQIFPPPPPSRLSDSLIIMSGGPAVNAPVRFYEYNRATENTPVYFDALVNVTGLFVLFRNSSTNAEETSTAAMYSPILTVGPGGTTPLKDYFVIEVFHDSNNNQVIIVYGYSGYGTFGGTLYFKNIFFPRQGFTLTDGYEIVRWNDTSGNGLPDLADAYTILHSSYVGPT